MKNQNRKTRASGHKKTTQTGSEADGKPVRNERVSKTCDYPSRPGTSRPARREGGRKRKPTHEMVNVTIDQLRASYYVQATLWP